MEIPMVRYAGISAKSARREISFAVFFYLAYL